ncbi:MAG: mechanosensitive ion channel [Methylococcaceae bacterium]|nr:mechanosensitive ion channel [Methylococcaceae bacterium]
MNNFLIVLNPIAYRSIKFNVIRALICLLILLLLAPVSAAPTSALVGELLKSSNTGGPVQTALDPASLLDDIKKKLAATQAEFAAVPSEAVTGDPATGLPANEDILARRLHLRQLLFIYQGQLSRLPNLQAVQKDRIELENKADNWTGFNEPSAHPFLRADELKVSVASLGKQVDELALWLHTLEIAGTQIVNIAENSIIRLRQANESVEQASKSPELQARLTRKRDLLFVQNQINLARTLGFQIEKQTLQEELLKTRAQLQLARKQLSVASEHAELTQQDIDQVYKNIEVESQDIIAALNQALSDLELENKSAQQEKTATNATNALTPAQLEQLHQAQHNNTDVKLQVLNRVLVYLQMQRDIWNIRWMYAKVTDREKASEAYDKISNYIGLTTAIREYVFQQRQRILEQITIQSVKEIDPTVTEMNTLRDALRKLALDQLVSYSRLLGALESTVSLLERCKQDMDERLHEKSLTDYLDSTLLTIREITSQIWTFEIFAVQDNIEVDGRIISGKRSVTVDKVVTAFAILIVGYWFAAHLSRFIERHAVSRLSMDASLARIARRWILFLQVILLVLLSMMVVKIPLTIFAFMGGALAIGVGFGMQNLLKNLISGLMLLFERPFRPGDVVEVGGIRGRVIDIGVRSSQILDGNGIETIIPNSTFIEENVTNWTLSSRSVRIVVNVGITYDSSIKEVNKLLLEVAERHGLVLHNPAPQVLFEDFGNDALLFGLYVWVEINPEVSWKTIASDLRYMISKVLAENNIVIAFSQRDVHLDTNRPLEIKVLSDVPC